MNQDVISTYQTQLSREDKKAIARAAYAYQIAEQFNQPFFEKAVRCEKLYNQELPPELDCTTSKIMLPIATSIVQNEIARSASTVLSEDQLFALQAGTADREYAREGVEHWLYHVIRQQNHIFPRIIPSLQDVGIIGTGYRGVTHEVRRRLSKPQIIPTGEFAGLPYGYENRSEELQELGIVCSYLDFYSVMPGPGGGGVVNPHDTDSQEGVEWLHLVRYLSANEVNRLRGKNGSNQKGIDALLAYRPQANADAFDQRYRNQAVDAGQGNTNEGMWTRLFEMSNVGLQSRYRCVWTFCRDQWILIGEDRFILFSGAPLLDWFPIAKYVDTPNRNQWHGTGLIEIAEDLILYILLNINLRSDYLLQTLHPTKFVSEALMESNGGESNDFDPQAFGIFRFNARVKDIQKAIWYDRFPDISPQAFADESTIRTYLQEFTGQPNYGKGMGGAGTLSNETASGIISLIEEGTARSSLRSLMIEYVGLQDELMLCLKYGKKYEWDTRRVRLPKGKSNWAWQDVAADLIDDEYGIELRGTRALVHKNEMVKRMLSVMPLLLNNPNVPGQRELLSQAMTNLGAFTNIDKILGSPQPATLALAPGQTPALAAGTPTLQNDTQSMMGEMPGGVSQQVQPAGRFAV